MTGLPGTATGLLQRQKLDEQVRSLRSRVEKLRAENDDLKAKRDKNEKDKKENEHLSKNQIKQTRETKREKHNNKNKTKQKRTQHQHTLTHTPDLRTERPFESLGVLREWTI